MIKTPGISKIVPVEFGEVSVYQWNQSNLSTLLDIQEATNEGCFFVGLYSLSAAFYPEKSLPDVNEFLNIIKSKYSCLLKKNTLTVDYSQIDLALKIYNEWGIKLKCISMNEVGKKIIGIHLKDKKIPIRSISTYDSLNSNQINTPYSILVHQGGDNNSHYITVDGTKKANDLKEKYLNDGCKTIALFEFLPNTIYDVVQERGMCDGYVTLTRAA